MDLVRIRVYYDFASTLCYVAHHVLTGVGARVAAQGVELEWRPIDMTMVAPWKRGDSFPEEIRDSVRATGLALGIDAEMPARWIDSRPAAQVALCVPTPGDEARWRSAVYASIFDEGETELTPELRSLAAELVGADPLPAGGEGFPEVEQSTREAIALGVTGVPTLLLDDWLVGGVFDGDSMVSIVGQLADRYRELGSSSVN